MKWSIPPIEKVYEALGSVTDGRVAVTGNTAKVTSSSGNKTYDVTFDPNARAIMMNDNASYWKGYVGYPGIAYLMAVGQLPYDPEIAKLLANVPWKDINQKFKNDFTAALVYVLSELSPENRARLDAHVDKIYADLQRLDLDMLGPKIKPPSGY